MSGGCASAQLGRVSLLCVRVSQHTLPLPDLCLCPSDLAHFGASATCATAAASISSQSVAASLWICSMACGDWRHVSVVPTAPATHLITLPLPAARRFVTCSATALAPCSSAGSASQLCTCGSCIERRTPVRRTWFGFGSGCT